MAPAACHPLVGSHAAHPPCRDGTAAGQVSSGVSEGALHADSLLRDAEGGVHPLRFHHALVLRPLAGTGSDGVVPLWLRGRMEAAGGEIHHLFIARSSSLFRRIQASAFQRFPSGYLP